MIGAIAGDIIGSVFEWRPQKTVNFDLFPLGARFTDDSVLTIAIAHSILLKTEYRESIIDFAKKFPNAGYGGSFYEWFNGNDHKPYNSWGNGSAMRVSPVGFAFMNINKVLEEAKKSAEITHNHPEGIKGAQATAAAIFLAKSGANKDQIKQYIESTFEYNLNRNIDEIRPAYKFDVSCQGSVPESIIAFLESTDFESAVRLAVSLGGDSDTQACIAGGIAQAFYKKVPNNILNKVKELLAPELLEVAINFSKKHNIKY